MRPHADARATLTVRTAAGTDFTATFDRSAGLGEDERDHQPALLVEPARRRGLHDAGVGGRHVRLRRHGRRLLQREVRQPRSDAARARDPRRPARVGATAIALDLERDFWSYCHTDANSDRVGELAFGTNLGLREMIGILLQDEKVPGVHLAFGDPYGSQTHADWSSRTHVDVLTRDCDVWIDDEQVIAEGQYLLEKFADVGPAASRGPAFRAGADVRGLTPNSKGHARDARGPDRPPSAGRRAPGLGRVRRARPRPTRSFVRAARSSRRRQRSGINRSTCTWPLPPILACADVLVLYASGDGGWFGAAVDMFRAVGDAGFYAVGLSTRTLLHRKQPAAHPLTVAELAEDYRAILDRASTRCTCRRRTGSC